ncbi:nucleopolyhedrovirus P10 family protein [Streptomyces sp. NPDC058374]|uniref:nucleopolyhedrovirus P10 family protein n=1 Tax=unclassified Streptomyces TaxID=2593676 RepID=UPI0036549C13
MSTDGWTEAVRHQLGLGRLLPMGGSQDGAWLTESAARSALRRSADEVAGVRLGPLRVGPVEGAPTEEPGVPPPPSALWPGPLRIDAEFAATRLEPFPALADQLRAALAEAAGNQLGLRVTEVDLRVTGVGTPREERAGDDDPPATGRPSGTPGEAHTPREDSTEARAASAALAVPGVARLGGAFGGRSGAVRVDRPAGPGRPGHVRVELAVASGHRPHEVARAVRQAVTEALPDRPSVAVLVTAVD